MEQLQLMIALEAN